MPNCDIATLMLFWLVFYLKFNLFIEWGVFLTEYHFIRQIVKAFSEQMISLESFHQSDDNTSIF